MFLYHLCYHNYNNIIYNTNVLISSSVYNDEFHHLSIKIGKPKRGLISKSAIFRIRNSC